MIAALLLAVTTPATGLGAIGRQQLPEHGCAAFFWSQQQNTLVGMAVADPAMLRIVLDGKPLDLARSGQTGAASLGFATRTSYAAGEVAVTLEMTVVAQQGLTNGATVPSAVLTVTRQGSDTLVVPTAGLVGCSPA